MNRIGLAVACVGLAAALTSCGGDSFTDKNGQEIADASKSAMGDLSAVKVSGSITTNGQDITIDIQTNSDAKCVGSIGVGDGTAEIVGVDGKTWFRPDEAFWTSTAGDQAAQILAIVGDKWVVVPPGDQGFSQFCDLDSLLEQLLANNTEDSKATFTTGDTVDVDGDQTVAVDRKDDKGTSTGYVLVDDPHYLVKIEKTEGEDTGTVTFSGFNDDFEAAAPATEDVIDLDNLGG